MDITEGRFLEKDEGRNTFMNIINCLPRLSFALNHKLYCEGRSLRRWKLLWQNSALVVIDEGISVDGLSLTTDFRGRIIVHPESFRSNAQNAIAFARRNRPHVNRSDRLRAFASTVCNRVRARTCVRSHLRACEVHLIKGHQIK